MRLLAIQPAQRMEVTVKAEEEGVRESQSVQVMCPAAASTIRSRPTGPVISAPMPMSKLSLPARCATIAGEIRCLSLLL